MRYFTIILIASFIFSADQIFITCEGNLYDDNGSLWRVVDEEASSYNNQLGEIVQSVEVHQDQLYVIVNGTSNIQIYDIMAFGLNPTHTISTDGSGPREMIVYNNYLYFTNWYSKDVKKLNLQTFQIDHEIEMPGLPEDITIHNGIIYVSITMNDDWTDGDQVITIDPESDLITDSYEVGLGPGELLIHNDEIYISRTYYDQDWNAFYGTSKINIDGNVAVSNYGAGVACGGGIYSYQNSVYRVYGGGIARLDENLEILPETRIGNYNEWEVYSAEVIDENVYFGLSDFSLSDEVAVVDSDGNELIRYNVGTLPGDYAIWRCDETIDLNQDESIDIIDIIALVNYAVGNMELSECFIMSSDLNNDNQINILDVLSLLNIILEQ